MRVPLIISGPGIPANQRTDAMCYLFDVLPTLGQLCAITTPAQSEGVELSATLREAAAPARPQLMFACKNAQRTVLQGNWKLIRYPFANRTQLFDLRLDPHEIDNLADQPEHAAKLAEITALLEQEMKDFGDNAKLTIANSKPAEWTPPGGTLPGKRQKSKVATEN